MPAVDGIVSLYEKIRTTVQSIVHVYRKDVESSIGRAQDQNNDNDDDNQKIDNANIGNDDGDDKKEARNLQTATMNATKAITTTKKWPKIAMHTEVINTWMG